MRLCIVLVALTNTDTVYYQHMYLSMTMSMSKCMASHPTQRISTAQIGHRIIRAALVAVVGLHGLRVDCIARHGVVLALAG